MGYFMFWKKQKTNNLDELDNLNQSLINFAQKNTSKIDKMNDSLLNSKAQQKLRKTVSKLSER